MMFGCWDLIRFWGVVGDEEKRRVREKQGENKKKRERKERCQKRKEKKATRRTEANFGKRMQTYPT